MLLKTKDREVNISIKAKTANKFEEKFCKEDESILTIIPQKSMARGKLGFMAEMLNFFQSDKEKLPIDKEDEDTYDMYDFMEDWCEENEKSVTDLYVMFLQELDVKGIIDRGMGFSIGKLIKETMEQAIEGMKNQKIQ